MSATITIKSGQEVGDNLHQLAVAAGSNGDMLNRQLVGLEFTVNDVTQAGLDAAYASFDFVAALNVEDAAINAIWWRIQRYESQTSGGIATTESSATYEALLTYVEALRNWPATSGFPDVTTMPIAP